MSGNRIVKAPDTAWWDYVSGPSLFVRETVDALCGGKNVYLCAVNPLSWRGTFFGRVADTVRETEESLLFERIYDMDGEPGMNLLKRFGLETAYRPTKSYADFIRERRVLANRVVCVTTQTQVDARRWGEFLKEYRPASVRDGLILLETQMPPPAGASKHVRTLNYSDFVSEYDALIFAGLCLPDNKMSIEQKRYLAALAVSFLGANAEAIDTFVKTFRIDADDPEKFDLSPHSPPNRRRSVWNAQMQTLFPLIMRECREFADVWRDRIEDAFIYANKELPYGLLDTNRMPVESPDEMELATIRYLMRNKRRNPYGGDTDEYILYIPDENARTRVELLYAMRNRIAHGKVCPTQEVVQLLNPF